MKLGIKNTYIDTEAKAQKGKYLAECNSIFFTPEINVSKHTFFYIRCHRILNIMLKDIDSEVFESLKEKVIEPPALFM